MPVIREYNRRFTDATGPVKQRQTTADDFGAAEGRALTQLGQATQTAGNQLYKRAEQKEVSELNKKLSKVQADNAIALQDLIRNTEPGDEKAFEEFERQAEERVNKASEGLETISGRNYFEETSSKLTQNLRVSTARTKAELDGEKAVLDYTESVSNLTAGLISDPSSLETSITLHEQGIDNLVAQGLLPAAQAGKLKQSGRKDLIKSSIRGWNKLNPEHAKAKLASGEFDKYIGGDTKVQLFGEIDQSIRAREIEAERQKKREREILAQEQTATQNEFLRAMEEGKLTANDILNSNLDAFGSGSKEQFLRMMKTEASSTRLKTNPGTFINLFDRINLPDGDPEKITSEAQLNDYLGNGLSITDLQKLREEVNGAKTEKGRIEIEQRKNLFNVAKSKLSKANPMLGIVDPEGEEKVMLFQQFVYDEMERHKKEGKPLRDLFNPLSKDYLGNAIDSYKSSPQEIMKKLSQGMTGPQPKEGEVKVSNGKQTFIIPKEDLEQAQADGFEVVN